MNVLLTGGAGFIGSHVVDTLIHKGASVTVVDNLSHGRVENVNPGARFHQLDIADPSIVSVFTCERFDYVLHFAGQISVRDSCTDPMQDARVNILGLLNLLGCCRTYGVKGMVFASSGGAVYGEPDTIPTPETAPKRPTSPYGVSKVASEFYLSQVHRTSGFPYMALRFSNVYGPRQHPEGEAGVIAIFLSRMLMGQPTMVFGDGGQVRDYLYVEDAAKACVATLDHLASRSNASCRQAACDIDDSAVNIGTGIATSVNELHAAGARITRYQQKPIFAPARGGETRRSCLDSTRAASALRWQPVVSLSTGMTKTAEWIRDHLAEVH